MGAGQALESSRAAATLLGLQAKLQAIDYTKHGPLPFTGSCTSV